MVIKQKFVISTSIKIKIDKLVNDFIGIVLETVSQTLAVVKKNHGEKNQRRFSQLTRNFNGII